MLDSDRNLLDLTASIVSAYVGQNSLQSTALSDLIGDTYAALARLGEEPAAPAAPAPIPATSVRKSITDEYLICLDDGLKFKSLKRHIATLGMTPDQYRKKWDLPSDYPMVAPAYAERRSKLAKSIGLGKHRKTARRS